tara:strand:+ start:4713 stop:5303 length:591 start_codon:yes stop_codon:yes gene_type:complete
MDRSIDYLLSKLKVLSKLQFGQKLIFEDSKIQIMETDKNNWARFVKWWLGETRYSTLDKLQGFFHEIKDIITKLAKEAENSTEKQQTLNRIQTELTSAMRGLNNLILTYQDDHTVVSQLETLTENFNIEINRLNDILAKSSWTSTIKSNINQSTVVSPPPPPPPISCSPLKINLNLDEDSKYNITEQSLDSSSEMS